MDCGDEERVGERYLDGSALGATVSVLVGEGLEDEG